MLFVSRFRILSFNGVCIILRNVFAAVYGLAGLQAQYAADIPLSLATHKLLAIVFIPVTDINSFELLQKELPNELQPVTGYFEDIFIGRPGIRNRRGIQSFCIIYGMYLNALQLAYHELTTILRDGIDCRGWVPSLCAEK